MSIAIEQTRLWTVEDLDNSSDTAKNAELWEGELVEMRPPMPLHNAVVTRAFVALFEFASKRPGLVCAGQCEGFVLQEKPATLYCPDVSVYRERGGDLRKRL